MDVGEGGRVRESFLDGFDGLLHESKKEMGEKKEEIFCVSCYFFPF